MKCPKCETENIYVSNSRNSPTRKGWMRKRKCQTCGYTFTTVERYSLTAEEIPNVKISRKEAMQREKIANIKELAKRLNVVLAED